MIALAFGARTAAEPTAIPASLIAVAPRDDLIQEAWLALLHGGARVREPGAFWGERRRGRAARLRPPEHLDRSAAPGRDAPAWREHRHLAEVEAWRGRFAATLAGRRKQVYDACFCERRTTTDTARALGLQPVQVQRSTNSILRRARRFSAAHQLGEKNLERRG